jgi:hypothetical protein
VRWGPVRNGTAEIDHLLDRDRSLPGDGDRLD